MGPLTDARRLLDGVGCGGRGGDAAARDRDPDRGFDHPPCGLLWRRRLQAERRDDPAPWSPDAEPDARSTRRLRHDRGCRGRAVLGHGGLGPATALTGPPTALRRL